ncbi:MAG: anti-sigma factor family protein [Vulcanimicrobiaceae bacterium]
MPCSSFEPLLAPYLDGALPPVDWVRLNAHLERCGACASLLDELRVIDGMLLTTRPVDPEPNFTFRVMTELNAFPAPRARRAPMLGVVAAYLVFSWLLIGGFFFFAGAYAKEAMAVVAGSLGRFGTAFGGLSTATSHLFGGATFSVTAAMSAILLIDLLVAVLAIGLHGALRARLSAAPSRPTRA